MSDRLLNYRCKNCKHSVMEFDPPEVCEKCNHTDGFSEYFGNISTTLASEGIMCEYVLDNNYQLDERNDRYTEEYLQNKALSEISKIRSDRGDEP